MKHYYALFSGGVDSALAVLKIMKQQQSIRITPLFFDYGQKAAHKEEEAVAKLIPLLRELAGQNNVVLEDYLKYEIGGTDLFLWSKSSILKGREDTAKPDLENRNMILISIAVSIIMSARNEEATSKTKKRRGLIVGFKNEHYDTKRRFAARLNKVIGQGDFLMEIITPLVQDEERVGARALARTMQEMGANRILSYAWSCYCPTLDGSRCKTCTTCKSRCKLENELRTRIKRK